MCEAVLACRNGTVIYNLVNQKHIIPLLNELTERDRVFEQKEIKREFLNTATMLVYFIARYNLVKFVSQDYHKMVNSVKSMFFIEF